MKKITLLGVMALLCVNMNAQQQNIKPLTVGDTVPDITFNNIINGYQKKINLYNFKNKHTIIDLWNRHCLACIAAFPKIEQYQKKYEGQLQFILANPHDAGYEKEVNALLKGIKERTGFYPSLPIALNDTLLNYYFPHNGVPHYIWINNKQQVAAITGLEEVTEQNIARFVKGEVLHLAVKDAPAFKSDLLALIRSGEIKNEDIISYSFFTGYQPYTNLTTNFERSKEGAIISFYIINQTLPFLIYTAYGSEINGMQRNRFINFPSNQIEKYCYQVKPNLPVHNLADLRPYLRADLQKSFGIKGVKKMKNVECLVIKDINNISALKSNQPKREMDLSKNSMKKFVHGYPLKEAILFLDQLDTPLLDETEFSNQVIDLDFPEKIDLRNESELITWFRNKGLVIKREKRLLEVFEFSSIN